MGMRHDRQSSSRFDRIVAITVNRVSHMTDDVRRETSNSNAAGSVPEYGGEGRHPELVVLLVVRQELVRRAGLQLRGHLW